MGFAELHWIPEGVETPVAVKTYLGAMPSWCSRWALEDTASDLTKTEVTGQERIYPQYYMDCRGY